MPLVLGGVGVLVLAGLGFMMMGGSGDGPKKDTGKKKASAPVDVSGHLNEARRRGEAGLKKGREANALRGSGGDRGRMRTVYEEALADLQAAMTSMEQAQTLGGQNATRELGSLDKECGEMIKIVRDQLKELRQ